MLTVNRKLIEDYYEQEWSGILLKNTLELLIELTCHSYHLSQPTVPDFAGSKEPQKPKRIGEL